MHGHEWLAGGLGFASVLAGLVELALPVDCWRAMLPAIQKTATDVALLNSAE